MERAEEVLRFWFGDASDGWTIPPNRQPKWFGKNHEVDEEIRLRFGPAVEAACEGGFAGWKETPRGRLALVILLDQFTRHIHRGTPDAFAGDPLALALSLEALDRGADRELRPIERPFLYLPLEHAEDSHVQQLSVDAFRRLAEEAPAGVRTSYDLFLDYAIQHQVIVDRFGRFPHRNAILGRASTPEEEAFLLQPGSSF